MHLVIWLALLVAVTSLISTQSTTHLGNIIWELYLKYSSHGTVTGIRAKRERLAEIRTQRSNTSSKDEFAKWARLDRDHRKIKTEIDELNVSLAQTRKKIQSIVRVVKFCSTTGLKLFVQWKYRKVPVIYLPKNVLPSTVQWFLSFPSAPIGSISVATWITITSTTLDAIIQSFKTTRQMVSGKQ